jgi:trimethylamine--corrinoid protein Co-methyltransferase
MKKYRRKIKPCPEMLSSGEIEKIHQQSLGILNNTGIEVSHEKALKILDKAGAVVDYQSQRVKIPSGLVAQALETLPEKCLLAARNPEKDCILEAGGRSYSRNGGGSDFTLDLDTGQKRKLMHSDMKDYFKLIDGLDHIDILAPLYGQDLPEVGRDIIVFREMLANSDKHIHIRAFNRQSMEFILRMAEIVAGGREKLKQRPIAGLLEAPVSPLKFIEISVDGLLLAGENGVPIELVTMPICGGTGPMTLAGSMLLMNAEFLAGVVISQTAYPGAPIEYSPRPMIMDMATGIGLTGSIEAAMMSAAGAQLAQHYNVPVSLHGPWTDSMTFDGQSTFERTNFAFLAGLSGANVLSGSGMVEQGLTFSHVQLVIDDEINSALYNVLEGFEVDDEHLGAEAIGRVGPGGNFLGDDHTLKFLRGERQEPNILYRNSRELWEADGSKSFTERARERARKIIQEHQPNPLPDDISKALDSMVNDALRLMKN